MTQTEQKVFEIISKKKRVGISEISKETGLSTAYAQLICQGFQRNGFINFARGLCSIIKEEEVLEKKPISEKPKVTKRTIERKAIKKKKETTKNPLLSLESIDEKLAKNLERAGFKTIENLSEASISRLMEISGIELKQAADIINEARKKLGKLGGSKSLFLN